MHTDWHEFTESEKVLSRKAERGGERRGRERGAGEGIFQILQTKPTQTNNTVLKSGKSPTVSQHLTSAEFPPVDSASRWPGCTPTEELFLSLKREPGVNEVLNHLSSKWNILDTAAVHLLNAKALGSIFFPPRLRRTDASVVRSTGRSSGGPGFDSWHPHDGNSEPPETLVPRDLMPSSASESTRAIHTTQT